MAIEVSSIPESNLPDALMRSGTQIVSVVCVLNGRAAEFQSALLELCRELASFNMPTELIAVLNEADSKTVATLRTLSTCYERLQIYVMKYRVDYETALLAGIENAIGDWVATIDVGADEPAVLRRLFDCALSEGSEVALSDPQHSTRTSRHAIVSTVFHRTFELLHGFSLARETPSARLLSRAAVNAILRHDSPLVAFETLTAVGGYRKSVVPSTQRRQVDRALGERVRLRWRTLIGMNAAPLRLANFLCGATAFSACSYSLFVIAVYLLKKDVVPGWTTVSLMLSFMFMMLALVLWLLSEYMLMLLDPGMRRPRYEIAEEIGGGIRSPGNALNVETEP